jgi:hypothetical protein
MHDETLCAAIFTVFYPMSWHRTLCPMSWHSSSRLNKTNFLDAKGERGA